MIRKDPDKSEINQTDENLMINRSGIDRQLSEQVINDDQQGGGVSKSFPSDREHTK